MFLQWKGLFGSSRALRLLKDRFCRLKWQHTVAYSTKSQLATDHRLTAGHRLAMTRRSFRRTWKHPTEDWDRASVSTLHVYFSFFDGVLFCVCLRMKRMEPSFMRGGLQVNVCHGNVYMPPLPRPALLCLAFGDLC